MMRLRIKGKTISLFTLISISLLIGALLGLNLKGGGRYYAATVLPPTGLCEVRVNYCGWPFSVIYSVDFPEHNKLSFSNDLEWRRGNLIYSGAIQPPMFRAVVALVFNAIIAFALCMAICCAVECCYCKRKKFLKT